MSLKKVNYDFGIVKVKILTDFLTCLLIVRSIKFIDAIVPLLNESTAVNMFEFYLKDDEKRNLIELFYQQNINILINF